MNQSFSNSLEGVEVRGSRSEKCIHYKLVPDVSVPEAPYEGVGMGKEVIPCTNNSLAILRQVQVPNHGEGVCRPMAVIRWLVMAWAWWLGMAVARWCALARTWWLVLAETGWLSPTHTWWLGKAPKPCSTKPPTVLLRYYPRASHGYYDQTPRPVTNHSFPDYILNRHNLTK